MADGEVRAQDLTEETISTLGGTEQFVMFDNTEGKRADIDAIATYIAGDKTQLTTTNKTSPVAAINEVKGETTDVKEDINSFTDTEISPNLFDNNAATSGYLKSDGAVDAYSDWLTSDFMPVEYGNTYTLSCTNNNSRKKLAMYFRMEYDSNRAIIQGTYQSSSVDDFTPTSQNAAFVRISFHTTNASNFCFVEGGDIAYYPYGEKTITIKEGHNSEKVQKLSDVAVVVPQTNLFDVSKIEAGYISNVNGTITIALDWFHSDYIPVEYGKSYVLYNNNGKQAAYFLQEVNENKVGVDYFNIAGEPYTPSAATVKYVRFCQHGAIDTASLVFEEGTQYKAIFTPYGDKLVPPYKNLLYGKKWVALGDSLTEKNSAAISNYTDFISWLNCMEIVNMGVGGTGYMRGYDSSIAFYQRAANIPSCDIITIFGSGNDLLYYSSLGDVTDTTTSTICGCMNETLDVIFANHPTTPLLVIAPTPWKDNTPDLTVGMALYCEKLSEICSRRGIAYLDLFHHSGLRPNDPNQRDLVFFDGSLDGHGAYVHPNKLGHQIIAPRIMQAMESVIMF